MDLYHFLILLAGVLLLPLLPAYLLYRHLPSKATVSGPFKGLNIKLTGAFGGYLVLVLMSQGMYLALAPGPGEGEGVQRETWRVQGEIELDGGEPVDLRALQVSLVPFFHQGTVTGANLISFHVEVPVGLDADGGLDFFPFEALLIEYPEHFPLPVWLHADDPRSAHAPGYRPERRTIDIGERIALMPRTVTAPAVADGGETVRLRGIAPAAGPDEAEEGPRRILLERIE